MHDKHRAPRTLGRRYNEIYVRLRAYSKKKRKGVAKADGVGYVVPELPSGRESFSPDASYYVRPRPANRMRFIEGAPTFAAVVYRSGDTAEAEPAVPGWRMTVDEIFAG